MFTVDDIESIIDNINSSINTFCYDNDLNLNEISSSKWNSVLMNIHKTVFNNGMLKVDKRVVSDDGILSSGNKYNYDVVNLVCDYYIYLCFLYGKMPSILGFCYMTGIDDNTIHDTQGYGLASRNNVDIKKKIKAAGEESVVNGLFDGSGNPVGKIAIANRFFDWQTAAAARGEQKPVLTADQLPDLSLPGGQKREFLPDTATPEQNPTNTP